MLKPGSVPNCTPATVCVHEARLIRRLTRRQRARSDRDNASEHDSPYVRIAFHVGNLHQVLQGREITWFLASPALRVKRAIARFAMTNG